MLQHVALEVRAADADAEVAFWALLGFAEVPPPASLAGRSRWTEREGTQVHLLLTDAPVAPPRGHAAVVARAYAETLARVAAAGHPLEARAEHWGAPRAFARSPAGHRVELMAAPPG
jgi:catechol 2,3-dioxygenase-like lactoylglutathione lyase family enzyme